MGEYATSFGRYAPSGTPGHALLGHLSLERRLGHAMTGAACGGPEGSSWVHHSTVPRLGTQDVRVPFFPVASSEGSARVRFDLEADRSQMSRRQLSTISLTPRRPPLFVMNRVLAHHNATGSAPRRSRLPLDGSVLILHVRGGARSSPLCWTRAGQPTRPCGPSSRAWQGPRTKSGPVGSLDTALLHIHQRGRPPT